LRPILKKGFVRFMDRKYWIDIAKGIGILCVIAGHTFSGPLRDALFVFHMPLFFFLSGLLFYPRVNRLGFLGQKAVHLLVPYFAFLLLLFIPRLYHSLLVISNDTDILLETVTNLLWGGYNLKGTAGVFWFVTCLFITQQAVNLILSTRLRRVAAFIFAASMCIGFANSIWFHHWQWAWAANVVFMAAPIVYLGYLLGSRSLSGKATIAAAILALAALIAALMGAPLAMDMKHADYGVPFLSLAAALCIAITVLQVSRWLEKSAPIRVIFGTLGRMSMTIMFLHLPVLVLFQDYFHIENQVLLLILAVAIPMIAHWVLERFAWSRAIYLGSLPDFSMLFLRRRQVPR
jgi:polysaccharide biosynthesis protein PslL